MISSYGKSSCKSVVEILNKNKFIVITLSFIVLILFLFRHTKACSVLYFIDKKTGNIFVANNEDFWYDTDAYIQIVPGSKNKLARLWYGWDDFAQGGINEAGFFFDGAVTPKDSIPPGYHKPKGNLGDRLLATCSTVEEAIGYLEKEKTALTNAHIMFGDSAGNAAIVEWVDGERKIIWRQEFVLVMTNFLLSDTTKGNYPCYRYDSIIERAKHLNSQDTIVTLLQVGNLLGGAAQTPKSDSNNRIGGTLYSSFIDISKMKFFLVGKLDNNKLTYLDLKEEFSYSRRRKIKLN
jgi:choloylglycine hydrolase